MLRRGALVGKRAQIGYHDADVPTVCSGSIPADQFRAVLLRVARGKDGDSGRVARDDGREETISRCRGGAEEPCFGRAAVGAGG